LKRQVYEVAEWLRKSFSWIPPRVINKAPTAELRPNQKDSDTIPEYAILDPIVEEYVVFGSTIEEIALKYQYEKEFVKDIIARIHRAEFKRRQCPFALRVSEKAFASGRRVPIVHRYSV
jgi:NAD+ synthase (glutamine-hydrolysing)